MSVLLVFPPFSSARIINLSLPMLAGYLRAEGVETKALDANVAFLRTILNEKDIKEGYRHSVDRFRQLNARVLTSHEERKQYSTLATTLHMAPRFRDDWEHSVAAPAETFTSAQFLDRVQAFRTAVNLVQFPFPDSISVGTGFDDSVDHRPEKFSSRYLVDQTKPGGGGILDGFFEDYLAPVLAERRYSVVGISVAFSSQIQAAVHCARAVKTIDPRVHVTLGGGFVSTMLRSPSSTALFEVVDSLVIDEGEVPLVRLHQELSSANPDLSRVPALIYERDGTIVKNEPVDVPAIETLPFPDYSDRDWAKTLYPRPTHQLGLRSSRGCSWRRCSFCRVNARLLSCREIAPAEYVYESMLSAIEQTGIRIIGFVDLETDTDVIAGLSQRIVDDKTMVFWNANSRLEPQMTMEKCMLYRKAGCIELLFGLESYNDRVLKLHRKGTSKRIVDQVLSNAKWAGLNTLCYIISGLPGETEEELFEGFAAILRMKKEGLLGSYLYSPFQLQTGSDVYKNPESYGLCDVRFPEGEDLEGNAEYFAGDVLPQNRAAAAARAFNRLVELPPPPEIDSVLLDDVRTTLKHDLCTIFLSEAEDLHAKVAQLQEQIKGASQDSQS